MEAVVGWFANPIHGTGDYPTSLKDTNQGLIPEFSPEDRAFIRGTADFFSLAFGPDVLRMGPRLPVFGQLLSMDLRKVLGWVKLEYGSPEVLVAESGWFTSASVREEDTVAIYLMRRLLGQVLEGDKDMDSSWLFSFSITMYYYVYVNYICKYVHDDGIPKRNSAVVHYLTGSFSICFVVCSPVVISKGKHHDKQQEDTYY